MLDYAVSVTSDKLFSKNYFMAHLYKPKVLGMYTNRLLKTAQCDLKAKQKYKCPSLGHDTVRSKFTCIFLLFSPDFSKLYTAFSKV